LPSRRGDRGPTHHGNERPGHDGPRITLPFGRASRATRCRQTFGSAPVRCAWFEQVLANLGVDDSFQHHGGDRQQRGRRHTWRRALDCALPAVPRRWRPFFWRSSTIARTGGPATRCDPSSGTIPTGCGIEHVQILGGPPPRISCGSAGAATNTRCGESVSPTVKVRVLRPLSNKPRGPPLSFPPSVNPFFSKSAKPNRRAGDQKNKEKIDRHSYVGGRNGIAELGAILSIDKAGQD